MNCCHNRQDQFKFVNSSVNVTVETEAENLEKYFQVIENRETDFQFFLVLEKMFPWLLIRSVFKTDACSYTGVAQSNQNDQNMVKWALQESVKRKNVFRP